MKNCFEIDPFEVDWLQKTRNELILDSVGSPEPMKQSIVMYNYKGEYVFQYPVDTEHTETQILNKEKLKEFRAKFPALNDRDTFEIK
mgnify:CR=1 FL=1